MTKESLTCEQIDASNPHAHVWVAASAGTGKTHVLTARVLRLLLDGVNPEAILCLTFTRAAAAEMAQRLRRTLGSWAQLEGAALDAAIYKACGARADAAMRRRARALFAELLGLAEGLRILTIHSFCQSLLGRFPLEAGLTPQFSVIEDAQARELLAAARDSVIAQARAPGAGALAEALAVIAMEVNEQDFDKLLGGLIGARIHLRRLLAVYQSVPGVLAALRAALVLGPDETEARIIADACADIPAVELEKVVDVLRTAGRKSDHTTAETLASVLETAPDERAASWETYRTVFLTKEQSGKLPEPRSLEKFPTKAVKAAWPEITDLLRAEMERLLAADRRVRLSRVVVFTEAALKVGAEILRLYDAEKAREGVLDYDDLIDHTRRLLGRPDIAPWILYKLDAGIDHLLVDEAQDTNPEQWAIIDALTEEFFAGDSARGGPRTLFAVGDVKQSIFRFQGAEPRAFIDARRRTETRAKAAALAFAPVSLDRSFRSSDPVLRLVDAVFADAAAARGLTLEDEAIAHRAHRVGDAGMVELWPVESGPETQEVAPWTLPLEQLPADSAESRLAVRIADRIHAMLQTGERLGSRDRPVRPGDIMVLVRRRTRFVEDLLKRLKSLDVPVAGADRMVVTEQLAVQDLIAIARFTLLAEDDLTLATVLKGPFIGLNEKELFELAHDRGRSRLWARLAERAGKPGRFADAYARLDALRDLADLSPPFEFFSELLTARGGRAALIARLGTEVIDPLDEFLRLAQDFERDHPPSLEAFLHWVESGRAEIKRDMEQGRDEVRLMTVHGAKGLEAPIVFLPDCCQTPQLGNPLLTLAPAAATAQPDLPLLIWRGNSSATEVGPLADARAAADAEEEAEYRRLLYVALTRAEERLIVTGWETNRNSRMPSWYEMVAAGFDRLEGVETDETGDGRAIRRFQRPQQGRPRQDEDTPASPGTAKLPDWARHPPADEPAPPRPLSPSRPDAEDPAAASPASGGGPEAYRRGRILHRLLELLPALPPEAREAAAYSYLRQPAHGLDATTIETWYREVADILEDSAFAPIFGAGSVAEAPMAGVIAGRVISGQVDRLAVGEREVLIVDYKTNRPPPERVEAVPQAYLAQMAAYRALLSDIFPDRGIRCALLWTAGPRLMELPAALLARYAPAGQATA